MQVFSTVGTRLPKVPLARAASLLSPSISVRSLRDREFSGNTTDNTPVTPRTGRTTHTQFPSYDLPLLCPPTLPVHKFAHTECTAGPEAGSRENVGSGEKKSTRHPQTPTEREGTPWGHLGTSLQRERHCGHHLCPTRHLPVQPALRTMSSF